MFLTHPYWLFALILLPLIAIATVMASHTGRKRWSQFVATRLRGTLIRRGNPIPRWLSFSFLMAATLLIILALTRPRGDGGTQSEKSKGRNLLVALDLSRSMRVDDVAPDRLSLAKLVIFELLEEMPNDRIGLIGFAGEPHLYAPLTIDHNAVRQTVEQMDESWPTLGGSDLGATVRLAIETLKKTGQRNNAMVILTDGEMHEGDLEQMITEAREAGVYIITVGVGTEDGGYVPHEDFPDRRMLDRKGNPVLSRLQSGSLRELARQTNGSFAVAGSGADIPTMIKSAISGLEAFEIEGRERKIYIEFFQWLVLPAIVLMIASLIAGTRWRGITPSGATALLIISLCQQGLNAQETPSPERNSMERYHQLANQALLESHKARYRLGEASAAYRLQNWDRASSAYSAALRTDENEVLSAAHHGIGNTLFQKGWMRFMDAPYTAESLEGPSMERFENAVRAKLAQLKQGQRVNEADPDEEEKPTPPFHYDDIERCILDWTDSVRHFQSVLNIEPEHEGATQNRELSLAYLRKLREILENDEAQSQEQLSQMAPEQGNESPNQKGDQGDENEPNGDPQQDPGNQPEPGDKGDPNGNQGERDPNGQPNPNQDPRNKDPNDPQDEKLRPGETPEENARRRLRESADSEKGPLTPGRIKFRKPEKDW